MTSLSHRWSSVSSGRSLNTGSLRPYNNSPCSSNSYSNCPTERSSWLDWAAVVDSVSMGVVRVVGSGRDRGVVDSGGNVGCPLGTPSDNLIGITIILDGRRGIHIHYIA